MNTKETVDALLTPDGKTLIEDQKVEEHSSYFVSIFTSKGNGHLNSTVCK